MATFEIFRPPTLRYGIGLKFEIEPSNDIITKLSNFFDNNDAIDYILTGDYSFSVLNHNDNTSFEVLVWSNDDDQKYIIECVRISGDGMDVFENYGKICKFFTGVDIHSFKPPAIAVDVQVTEEQIKKSYMKSIDYIIDFAELEKNNKRSNAHSNLVYHCDYVCGYLHNSSMRCNSSFRRMCELVRLDDDVVNMCISNLVLNIIRHDLQFKNVITQDFFKMCFDVIMLECPTLTQRQTIRNAMYILHLVGIPNYDIPVWMELVKFKT